MVRRPPRPTRTATLVPYTTRVRARDAADGGRVLIVLGAGGDREPSKRPEMGQVAARLADRVLLTSDNPRGEDPLAIIDAIRSGMTTTAGCTVEPDRAAAIALAIVEARPGDVVLLAGKGPEAVPTRPEELLVGKECVRSRIAWWSQHH